MKVLAWLVFAVAAWAAAPLDGTWKLDTAKSSLNAPLPSFMSDGTMSIRPGGTVPLAVPPPTL